MASQVVQFPEPRDTTEFHFKLNNKLQIFPPGQPGSYQNYYSCLAVSTKFGLIFAGTNNGFTVLKTSLLLTCEDQRVFPRRDVDLGLTPTHICLNSDQSLLAVGVKTNIGCQAFVYSVQSFSTQKVLRIVDIRLPPSPDSTIQDLGWNPGVINLLTVCFIDGSLGVIELKPNSVEMNSLPSTAQTTCYCWSPKGKQIVVGNEQGTLTQYKPDLKPVKTLPAPNVNTQGGQVGVVNVHWLSNYQFLAVYKTKSSGDYPMLMIVNAPKNEPVMFINYEELTYSSPGSRQPQFYIIHQPTWNMLFISSSSSIETAVLVLRPDNVTWEQLMPGDSSRAELPLNQDKQETFPIGLILDTSNQHRVQWSSEEFLPPLPILAILSHEGLLCLFTVVNMLPNTGVVCNKPDVEVDPALFVQQSVSPVVQQPAPPVQQPVPPVYQPAPPVQHPAPLVQQPPAPSVQQSAATVVRQQEELTIRSVPQQQPQPPQTAFVSLFPQQQQKLIQPVVYPSVVTGGQQASSTGDAVNTSNIVREVPTSTLLQLVKPAPPAPVVATVEQQQAGAQIELNIKQSPVESPSPGQELATVDDSVYMSAVSEEIDHFEQELHQLLARVSSQIAEVGQQEEKLKLRSKTDESSEFLKELKETTTGQNGEVYSVKVDLIESFALLEDAKSRHHQLRNPSFIQLKRAEELDPISFRLLADMTQLQCYVEIQLRQLNQHLDKEWLQFQDDHRQHVKGKMRMPSMENVYKTMLLQIKILNKQQHILEELKNKIKEKSKKMNKYLSAGRLSNYKTETTDKSRCVDLSKLAENLLQMKIRSSPGELTAEESVTSVIQAKLNKIADRSNKLTFEKQTRLREKLCERGGARIKPVKPAVQTHDISFHLVKACSTPNKQTPTVVQPLSVIAQPSVFNVRTTSSSLLGSPATTTATKSLFGTPPSTTSSTSLIVTPATSTSTGSVFQQATAKPNVLSVQSSTSTDIVKEKGSLLGVPPPTTTTSVFGVQQSQPTTSQQTSTPVKGVVFGTPSTNTVSTTPSAGGLLTSLTTTSSIFGSTTTSSGSSLFGTPDSTVSTTTKTTPLSTTAAATTASSIVFGIPLSTTTSSSEFGTPATTTTSSGLFGTSSAVFGAPATGTPTARTTSSTPNIFGSGTVGVVTTGTSTAVFSSLTTTASGPSIFGTGKTVVTPATTSSVSGTPTAVLAPGGNVFGTTTPAGTQSTTTNTIVFGTTTTAVTQSTTTSTNVFGTTTTAVTQATPTSSIVFGTPTTAVAPGRNIFETPTTAVTQATTTSSNVFGTPTTSVVPGSNIFGPMPPASTTPATTKSVNIFGTAETAVTPAPTPSANIFVTATTAVEPAETPSVNIFGTAATAFAPATTPSTNIFGTATTAVIPSTTPSANIFGTATTAVTPATTPSADIFGTATTAVTPPTTTTTSNSIFTTPTTARTGSIFGTPTTSSSLFGTTASSGLFGPVSSSSGGIFSSITPTTTTNIFGAPTPGSGIFSSQSGGSLFGTPVTGLTQATIASTGALFGAPVTSTSSTPAFGTPPAGTSIFGTSTTKSSEQTVGFFPEPKQGATPTSGNFFSTPTTSSGFFTPSTTSSVFGQVSSPSVDSTSSLFSQLSTPGGSLFGNSAAPTTTTSSNIFGQFGQSFGKPATTTTTTNIFGQTPTSTSSSSIFGQNICSPFSSNQQSGVAPNQNPFASSTTSFGQNLFGQTPQSSTSPTSGFKSSFSFGGSTGGTSGGFGSAGQAGGGLFSGGQSTIAQSGFGSPPSFQKTGAGFGSPPTFGGSSTSGAFGAPPTFGSSPTFGNAATFGSTSPTGSFNTGQSAFGNLATQNTVGFGSLAAQQGQPQQQQPPPQQQQPSFGSPPTSAFGQGSAFTSSGASFGGNSFSSWR